MVRILRRWRVIMYIPIIPAHIWYLFLNISSVVKYYCEKWIEELHLHQVCAQICDDSNRGEWGRLKTNAESEFGDLTRVMASVHEQCLDHILNFCYPKLLNGCTVYILYKQWSLIHCAYQTNVHQLRHTFWINCQGISTHKNWANRNCIQNTYCNISVQIEALHAVITLNLETLFKNT